MRLHRNAKTTPLMRRLIIDRIIRQDWTPARSGQKKRAARAARLGGHAAEGQDALDPFEDTATCR